MASSAGTCLYRQAQRQTHSVVYVLLAVVVCFSWAQLEREGKEFLLESHNDFRASVGASNMRLMVRACIQVMINTPNVCYVKSQTALL